MRARASVAVGGSTAPHLCLHAVKAVAPLHRRARDRCRDRAPGRYTSASVRRFGRVTDVRPDSDTAGRGPHPPETRVPRVAHDDAPDPSLMRGCRRTQHDKALLLANCSPAPSLCEPATTTRGACPAVQEWADSPPPFMSRYVAPPGDADARVSRHHRQAERGRIPTGYTWRGWISAQRERAPCHSGPFHVKRRDLARRFSSRSPPYARCPWRNASRAVLALPRNVRAVRARDIGSLREERVSRSGGYSADQADTHVKSGTLPHITPLRLCRAALVLAPRPVPSGDATDGRSRETADASTVTNPDAARGDRHAARPLNSHHLSGPSRCPTDRPPRVPISPVASPVCDSGSREQVPPPQPRPPRGARGACFT
ncbi:hypothetical protein BJ991_000566 [Microbacterium immunditiarum]|uniref:Uncharacterized protein n=1 Tax=Microbacterium immunditiarum TaxID=337480 RepID=A0A7Y9GL62_9MICO|nr:hypothetical protein [Microbacterium immunditiarum]